MLGSADTPVLDGCLKKRNIFGTVLIMKQLKGGPVIVGAQSVFWDDLVKDLEDPEFLREYIVESIRISTIDAVVGQLDEVRDEIGLSKAELARAIGAEPAVVRRLFANGHVNPTLGTLAEVAAALGMRVSLEPLHSSERTQVTESLLAGRSSNPKALVNQLSKIRRPGIAS